MVFETKKRREMVHITNEVEQDCKGEDKIKDRSVLRLADARHRRCCMLNDHESGPERNIGKWLQELAPARPDYKRHKTGEDNGDAHLKSLLLHHRPLARHRGAVGSRHRGKHLLRRVLRQPATQARHC